MLNSEYEMFLKLHNLKFKIGGFFMRVETRRNSQNVKKYTVLILLILIVVSCSYLIFSMTNSEGDFGDHD